MEWLVNLFTGSGVAHSVFIVALVIAIGLGLNRIKFGSVSLGVTWILFVGIVAGHFGFLLDATTAHFVKEFGLILFIYSIGLEVGPGFFSSFRKGGITLNMLAVGSVLLACCTAYVIHLIAGNKADHRRLFNLILQMQQQGQIRFTQLIWEGDGRWIHVSYVPSDLKCQVIE